MVEGLALTGDERVLEVGTGYGWETALLARLSREVFSVERFADLAETARAALAGIDNVTIVIGDGSEGWADDAPFDAILVAAAYRSCRHRSRSSWSKAGGSCSRSATAATRMSCSFRSVAPDSTASG
jgi:SAM-dependent methyltransferase